jgi:hypothetical protein
MVEDASRRAKDWVGDVRSSMLAWGLPTVALVATAIGPPSIRTPAWPIALVWMGAACLANARRCSRTHCYLTGPFFLVMAVAVLSHGVGLFPLGPRGWTWLGTVTAFGAALLWFFPEALVGRYQRRRVPSRPAT